MIAPTYCRHPCVLLQLGNLDEQLSDLRKELSEHRHLLDEKEQQLRHLSEESTNKNERIRNLEKVCLVDLEYFTKMCVRAVRK